MTDSPYQVEDSPFGRVLVPRDLPSGIALFTTTIDSSGRLDQAAAALLSAFMAERFGVRAVLNTCTQVHGATAVRVDPAEGWNECDSCDALWSAHQKVALGIKVADCLPITMVDPSHTVIANVHSGWRGTVQRIAGRTLDALEAASAFRTADAHVWLGPSIRSCCFEVGEEVAERFLAEFEGMEPYVNRSGARPHLDLVGLTRAELIGRGFRADRIVDSGVCTRCEGSIFHSYRRERGSGRNLVVVAQ